MGTPRHRRRTLTDSPAASLFPQMREELERTGRIRRRRVDADLPSDSPGKLYTYVSAGRVELPGETGYRRRFVARSPKLAIVLAAALCLVWLLHR
ncbi:MAG: hypothetical protein IJV65_09945 [Kiritimatiellae bacterium]|nr:hypothetical protein [Kiritimatiellia bacterium]